MATPRISSSPTEKNVKTKVVLAASQNAELSAPQSASV